MILRAIVYGLKRLVGENNLDYSIGNRYNTSMKTIILILALSFLCPLIQAQQKNSNEIYFTRYSSDSIGAYYGSSGGNLSMKFIVDSSGYLLKSIRVYSGNKLIQNISAHKDIESMDFGLDDYNFDGYKDISVLADYGSGGRAYWIWNYSPKDRKFHYNKRLSDQLGLVVVSRSRRIIIYNHQSSSEWGADTYKYRLNKLVLLSSEYHNTVRHKSTLWEKSSFKRRVGNKWVTRIDSTKCYHYLD